jgi:hypothetical protein
MKILLITLLALSTVSARASEIDDLKFEIENLESTVSQNNSKLNDLAYTLRQLTSKLDDIESSLILLEARKR